MSQTTLQVQKNDLATARLVKTDDEPLRSGQVRMQIERFALTANNITYAALGQMMNYWSFFPTGDADWGIIPAWGFGVVRESLCESVPVGTRLYGFFPMASSCVLSPVKTTPGKTNEKGFLEGAEHRAALSPIYNQYIASENDPFYTPDSEDVQVLFRPLFTTAWLLSDFLTDNGVFGATTVLVSSASSKTAFATAFQLAANDTIKVIGLTSGRSVYFCQQLGCYAEVLPYEQLRTLKADTPCVYLDFSGDVRLRREIHEHFTGLRFSSAIGATHVGELGGGGDLLGPRPVMFFAPAQAKKRAAEWGAARFGERVAEAYHGFRRRLESPELDMLRVERHRGTDAIVSAYLAMLGGRVPAATGLVLTVE